MSSPDKLTRFEIEDRILASLKRREGVATAGDVAADTGLNMGDVETGLRAMLSRYKSHLDVDDDGNLRYRFDPGFVRRGEDPARLWHDIRTALWTAFKWVFKVWIMVMLVGYTIAFLLLLVAMAIASIAASVASDSDSDGLVEIPLYLLARTLEFLFWISLFDDSSDRRRHRRRAHRKAPKPEKAFYQKVFDYVFGPDRKVDPLKAQAAFAGFVRELDGRVTAADWAARTGQSLEEAENALTAAVVRYHGDVDVSDEGQLIYRFDELMVTAARGGAAMSPARIWSARAKLPSFTGNPGGTNVWITIFNAFNLFMSFSVLSAASEAAATGVALAPAITVGLGYIPLVFSLIFFAVPALRYVGHLRATARAEHESRRRQQIKRIYDSVAGAQAEPIVLDAKVEKELAAGFDADVRVDGSGRTFYVFDALKEQLEAGARAREAAAGEVVFGETVFSSDEREYSLEQAELDDFDARLARELEGSHVEFDVAVPQTVGVN